jgi:Excalibur calcium-binding domain
MALALSSAAIPLAAFTTFCGVYFLTPSSGGGGLVPIRTMPSEAPQTESAVDNSNPSKLVGVQRRSSVPEYTYSKQRKLEGASKVSDGPDVSREQSVYYAGCRDVRAAGAAPLYRGDPGYRSGMDGDNDGIACEPHHGR